MVASALLVAVAVVVTVSFELFDSDLWTHLVLGKAILQLHHVPDRHAWIWPVYAEPEISPSWLFQVLAWPSWSAAGVLGLFVLRWLAALAVSGLTWATARRMGARGFAALGVLLFCAVQLGIRSQIRPEGWVAVLIALEIYLLESARLGGRDRTPWIVAVLWAWANLHVSSPLGFLILAAYAIDEAVRARRAGQADRGRLRRLVGIGFAGLVVSLANPFGWRTLWLPFDYFLHLRHEPLTASVLELRPFPLRQLVGRGLILPLLAWPLLTLFRPAGRRPEVVEVLLCLAFTTLALQSRRFIGFYLVTAAPFLMRDVDAWLTAIGWRGWRAPIRARAALLALLCLAVVYRRWTQPAPRLGVSINYENVPVGACDFMAAENVRGRAFNAFDTGGYLLYRFWPDRARLPFMDTQMSGGPRNRLLYWQAMTNPTAGWAPLDAEFHFDYVLMGRLLAPDHPLLDVLDADTSLALVFADDAAALYVRRRGPLAAVAARFAYTAAPAGRGLLPPAFERCRVDSSFRASFTRELERRADASPWNAMSCDLLASLALQGGDLPRARGWLERALRANRWIARAHERLGLIALASGQGREAVRELEIEHRLDPRRPGLALRLGQAWQLAGDANEARKWYRRELTLDPGNGEALDSLRTLR